MCKRVFPILLSCIFLMAFLLAGCAPQPAPERGELCIDVLVHKNWEMEPRPTSWELAEYLRELPKEELAIPAADLSEEGWPHTWIFSIDGVQYEYWSDGDDEFYLVSENGKAYPIQADKTLSILACFTQEGQAYYDASFDGYLLQTAWLVPGSSRPNLMANLYLNNEFYLMINNQRVDVNVDEHIRKHILTKKEAIQPEDLYWTLYSQLHISESTLSSGEYFLFCSIGYSINTYGCIENWTLYRYTPKGDRFTPEGTIHTAEDKVEQVQYKPGELDKLHLVTERRGDTLWWRLPALDYEWEIWKGALSPDDNDLAAYEKMVQEGDLEGLGFVDDVVTCIDYSHTQLRYGNAFVLQYVICTTMRYQAELLEVTVRDTPEGLVIEKVEVGDF